MAVKNKSDPIEESEILIKASPPPKQEIKIAWVSKWIDFTSKYGLGF